MSEGASAKSLSDRAGFLILANIIKYAIGVLIPVSMVRLLSPADYGTWQQLILVGGVLVSLLTLGLPTSVFYFYRHAGPQRVPALVMQTTLLLAVGGLVGIAISYLGAGLIARSMGNPAMAGLLMLGAASVGLVIASEQSIAFLIAQNRYGLAVVFEVGEAAVRVALLFLPLWLGYGLVGLVVCGVVYTAIRFAVRTYVLFARSDLDFAQWRRSLFIGEQLDYSIPIALIALVSLLGATFNKGILSANFGPAQFAVFAVGSIIFPLAQIFQAAVTNVLRAEMPGVVKEGNLAEFVRVAREAVRKLSIIVLPSFVFLLVHAYLFVTVLFTKTYVESVKVFRICIWELPIDMLILSVIPQLFGKTRANLYINIAATAAMLVGSYLLVPRFGVYGAAIVSVGAQYFAVALFFIVALRLTGTSLVRLLPFPGILRVLLASLIAAFASWLGAELTSLDLVNLLIAGVIFTAVFFSAAAMLGTFTAEDRRLARRWVAKVLPLAAG